MCGICGIWHFEKGRRPEMGRIEAMCTAMRHRGPDAEGSHIGDGIGMGHRRLSIIDLATGDQPMHLSHNGRSLVLVFNGEIYNYRILRSELSQKGAVFTTSSDTEVILWAWFHWGPSCVERLRGMFAFALYDETADILFLARDRLGIKPLYVAQTPQALLFASEIRALLASGRISADLNRDVLDAFLSLGYVPGEETLFAGIHKLPPGNWMLCRRSKTPEIRRYWDLADTPPAAAASYSDACRKLKHLLAETVSMHLMSDVPLGVFLSGGLDSSLICALAARESGSRIQTFSVGYEGAPEANELAYARIAAKAVGTDHHEFILSPGQFRDLIPELVETSEEPIVETAAIALHQIAKAARPHATVLLSGEGADEVFAGYGIYAKMLALERLHRLAALFPKLSVERLNDERLLKYIDWVRQPLDFRFRGTSADLTPSIRRRFYTKTLLAASERSAYIERAFGRLFKNVSGRTALSKMLYVDTCTWLVDDLLLKADKMTMAASIELRVPFLDHVVVEWAFGLPDDFKRNGRSTKRILRDIAGSMLPDILLKRPKMGFAVPTKRWFSTDLIAHARKALSKQSFRRLDLFEPGYIDTVLNRHEAGKGDYSRRIFSLLVLQAWIERYVPGWRS
uniref:asparagine synthase (glutamine-hydrolyzing) n=1 Tax=Desulfatirhabdium butyrativorans TaxID=340467 RepID=A0A7C4RRL2_9BACT